MQVMIASDGVSTDNGHTFHPRHLDKVFLEGMPAGDGQTHKTLSERNTSAALRIYSNLEPGQMRLLKLHRGTGRLRCSIIVATDCNHLSYEALSYVWGSEHHPKQLQLNNRSYYITQNLDKALRQLRSRDQDRILWVDALVINQSDLSERENEIEKMSGRFSGATRTIAWIGHADSWLEQFLNSLNEMSLEQIRSLRGGTQIRILNLLLRDLPYWSRAWIVQEIMFSKAILLMYGSATVPYDKLEALEDTYTDVYIDPREPTVGNTQLQVRPGAGLRHEWLRFPFWLKTCSTKRLCKEPQDRILAYRNCFSPDAREFITVDYTQSEYDSAREIVHAWIASEKNVDFLKHIAAREPWPSDLSIPTWLPNFFGKATLGINLENASGELESDLVCTEPPPKLLEDDYILQVPGLWLGDVDRIQENVGNFEERDTAVNTLLQHCGGSLDTLGKHTTEHIRATYNEDKLLALAGTDTEIQENLKIYFERKSKDAVFHVFQLLNLMTFDQRTSVRFRPCEFSYLDATSLAFGLGPTDIKIDDRLCLIMGCSVPLVLRRNGQRYTVVGNILTPFVVDVLRHKEFKPLWKRGFESIELS